MTTKTTTNVDELIEQERRRASERIAKLKRAAAAEQHRVDAKVVELLKEQKNDLYDRLAREAEDALDAEKAKRSKRAKKAASPSSEVGDESALQAVDPEPEEVAPWNG